VGFSFPLKIASASVVLPKAMGYMEWGGVHQSLHHAVWTFNLQNGELNKPLYKVSLPQVVYYSNKK
jgi:hypothetical protein